MASGSGCHYNPHEIMAEKNNMPSIRRPTVLLTHSLLLGQRLVINGYIRYLVAGTIAIGALFAHFILGIRDLQVGAFIITAGLIAIYNVIVLHLVRPYRGRQHATRAYRFLVIMLHLTVTLDYLSLTFFIYLVGGARSPFVAFYLLHLVLSGVMMSERAACTHSFLAYTMLAVLAILEWLNMIKPNLPLGMVYSQNPLTGRYILVMLGVYAVLFALTTYLLTSLSQLIRAGERDLRAVNEQLQQLSQHRRDFLHVAMHNLKSPVAAVIMMLSNLRDGLGGPMTDQQKDWINRSLLRLRGSTDFLNDLQMLATIESGNLDSQAEPVDLRVMLNELIDQNRDLAENHGHELSLDIPDQLPTITGISRLLREAIVNYITNAIKYTPDGGHITVRAMVESGRIHIEVQDSGVGITPADQKKLFNDFVRLKHKDTAVANVPGAGLGLSIVKRIVEYHNGSVYIHSRPNEGSTFGMTLPRGL